MFSHYCREFEQVNADRDIARLPKLGLTEIFLLKQMEFMKYFGKTATKSESGKGFEDWAYNRKILWVRLFGISFCEDKTFHICNI